MFDGGPQVLRDVTVAIINMSSTSLHNTVNVGPLTAETGSGVWDTPANSRVSHLGFITAPTCSTEVNQTLHDVWPYPGLHFFGGGGALAPNGILPGAKFTLRPSLALPYIGSVTARQWSSGRPPNFAAWYLHATAIGGHPVRRWAAELSSYFLFCCQKNNSVIVVKIWSGSHKHILLFMVVKIIYTA